MPLPGSSIDTIAEHTVSHRPIMHRSSKTSDAFAWLQSVELSGTAAAVTSVTSYNLFSYILSVFLFPFLTYTFVFHFCLRLESREERLLKL